ncbi:replication-associated recombination protein A [Mariniblastus fucicola]|uniref:Replication-associated recombination protein A n=1 Tax=Mariniblastus fucicola TaxID=980251 RepID=A0A5B9P5K9_9BACT|nr:replication-associated recombination protein A [Mariniblastus fucicola]QEG20262.1 Replication-associated recombination protein A [Mariniblastus fucicola]
MSLFEKSERANRDAAKPLAARMRPQTLEEFSGQQHFIGEGQLLRKLVEADRIGSILFFGPPGTGKTTLARILARATKRKFAQLSAILHGVKDLREVLSRARDDLATGQGGTLLFIDEIHRFNRSQQDAMLADVEDGVVTLIGATTSNPFFAVNGALVSRSQIFQFEPLSPDDIRILLERAIADQERGLGEQNVKLDDDAMDFLCNICDGDARKSLSILETAVIASDSNSLSRQDIVDAMGTRAVQYDPTGDEHYDCASALIKSIRGSDPDAGLYWLARMLEGGEDIRFICRRLIILASEDIGNADPHALPLAVACSQACEQIGLPECQLTLSQTVTYLAVAPKSNSATTAISMARKDVRENRVLPVPRHLRDSHFGSAEQLGHAVGYQYSHNEDDGVSAQDYLGVDREYYQPVDRGFEEQISQRLKQIREKLKSAKDSAED